MPTIKASKKEVLGNNPLKTTPQAKRLRTNGNNSNNGIRNETNY